jgi:predicted Zn-dependent peptidase
MRFRSILAALATVAATLSADSSLGQTQTAARKQPPPPAAERPFTFPAHTSTKLDNGLTVFVVEDHRQPVVAITLMIPGAGSSSHPGTKAGLAAMTAALLRQGTSSRSAQQVAETIDSVGGSLTAFANEDSTQASVTVVTTALETGAELLADVVQRPAFASEEIERWRRQTLSNLQVAYSDPDYLRGVVSQRIAYRDHPYGYPTDGFPNTVPGLSRDDVAAFYRDRYTPSGSYLAVAGDITSNDMVELIRKHFGVWKSGVSEPVKPPAVQHQRRIVVVDKPDAVQTQFGMVGPGVPRSHRDWLALTVANQVLGGGFNSRLNLRLRAKEGLTYGARSAVESELLAGVWNATSFTRTEETIKAIQVTLEVIRDFKTNPVTAAELTEATSYLSGVFAIQTETADAVAGRVLTSALHGLPADYWQTYRDRVRKVAAADVTAVVQQHLNPDQLSIVAVGNASAFAKGLETLGTVSVVPLAQLDLTQPQLVAKREEAAGPDAAAKGLALIKAAADAVGGAAVLASVKDATTTGTITLNTPGGEMKGASKATVVHPDKVKMAITMPMGELVQVYDGSQAWVRMGPQPPMELPAPVHPEMRRSILMNGGVGLLREALDGQAQVAALEPKTSEGTTLERVSWKRGDLEMVVGFDPTTHRIATVNYRGLTPQGPADSELRVADYQKAANGLMVPMRATTYQNGQKAADLVISEWQFNVGAPADAFAKPQ